MVRSEIVLGVVANKTSRGRVRLRYPSTVVSGFGFPVPGAADRWWVPPPRRPVAGWWVIPTARPTRTAGAATPTRPPHNPSITQRQRPDGPLVGLVEDRPRRVDGHAEKGVAVGLAVQQFGGQRVCCEVVPSGRDRSGEVGVEPVSVWVPVMPRRLSSGRLKLRGPRRLEVNVYGITEPSVK